MASRLELQSALVDVLGSKNVYFQPPESVKLNYPCIVYSLANRAIEYADDEIYIKTREYDVVFIGRDPDTEVPDRLLDSFQMIKFDRRLTRDNLYHDYFTLYF